MMTTLQEKWTKAYERSIEVALVAVVESMHNKFYADNEKLRRQMEANGRTRLRNMTAELDHQLRAVFNAEVVKLSQKHAKELDDAKRRQWCWLCESEAIYFCCWNSSYCSLACQQRDWPTHRQFCRRKSQL